MASSRLTSGTAASQPHELAKKYGDRRFPPMAESKILRCTRGALLDIIVIVDLRPREPDCR